MELIFDERMAVLETQGVLLPETAGKETAQEDSGRPKSGVFLRASHMDRSGAKTTLFISITRVSTTFPLKTDSVCSLVGTLLWPSGPLPASRPMGQTPV